MSLFLFHVFPSSSTLPSPRPQKLVCNFNHFTSQIPIKRNPISTSPIPATDRVIDFGRHKGKMLGTLPSKYLKWVSKNLRARDFEEWAKLADQVLEDPVYKDRLEWEFAENILTGDDRSSFLGKTENSVQVLNEYSERFGWDNDDKLGWNRIDFSLLGTSKGGRIPRKNGSKVKKIESLRKNSKGLEDGENKFGSLREGEDVGNVRGKREMRLERQRQRLGRGLKMQKLEEKSDFEEKETMNKIPSSQETVNAIPNPFPGRESLIRKVLDRRRVL